jgi:hypothetical protein
MKGYFSRTIQLFFKSIVKTTFYIHSISMHPRIHVEVNRLKTITTWVPLIPQLKNLHNFHVIIQTLNTTSLRQHYEDINHDHNLQMFHILCFI